MEKKKKKASSTPQHTAGQLSWLSTYLGISQLSAQGGSKVVNQHPKTKKKRSRPSFFWFSPVAKKNLRLLPGAGYRFMCHSRFFSWFFPTALKPGEMLRGFLRSCGESHFSAVSFDFAVSCTCYQKSHKPGRFRCLHTYIPDRQVCAYLLFQVVQRAINLMGNFLFLRTYIHTYDKTYLHTY